MILLIISCKGKYAGFKDYTEKIHVKLRKIGDDELQIRNGDYLMLETRFCSTSECDKRSARKVLFTRSNHSITSEFWDEFRVGDEMTVILDSGVNVYWLNLFSLQKGLFTWPLIWEGRIMASLHNREFLGVQAYRDSLFHFRELSEVKSLISNDDGFEFKSGCYIQVNNWGKGDSIKEGVEVALSYQGFFTDGTKFDDTDNWQDTLKFVYGLPMQIILGLELGIEGLTEGSEAKIIIPSQLAFGKEGSSSGIVPPYEPLVYKIKILSVKELET